MKHLQMARRAVAGLALLAVASGLVGGCDSDDSSGTNPLEAELERIELGLQLSPVPLDLEGLDRGLVGLGSYIVNAQGGCNDCHTHPPFPPGNDPFKGEPERVNSEHFLAGGVAFGPLVSPNITPDEEGRPAGLTWEEFLALMRTGREEDGELLQVMPWPIYGKMREQDLRAIYEYLRAIPPAQPGTAPPPSP